MEKQKQITIDSDLANRNNTARALLDNGHYDFKKLADDIVCHMSYEVMLGWLQNCAEEGDDTEALRIIEIFVSGLWSAYEIQRGSYRRSQQ